MKKIIALVLSVVMICCFSVTAFAAESPTATEKITVTVRKADITNPVGDVDVKYTHDKGATITVKADSKYGEFNSWSIYKVEASVEGTAVAGGEAGLITLSAVKNLATTSKVVKAVEGTDYDVVKGSLTSSELVIEAHTSLIICGNYDNKITDPNDTSIIDDSDDSDPTGDTAVYYIAIVILAAAAFAFGVKKIYSK